MRPTHVDPLADEYLPMILLSGGQSGVDGVALDAALAHGIDYGGWCPKGGWAEDFREPPGLLAKYPKLKETPCSPIRRSARNGMCATRMRV
jgi:hypothetical protein